MKYELHHYLSCIGLLILLMGFALSPVRLQAAESDGLYEAQVTVAGQGAAERAEGLRAALREVLIKVAAQPRAIVNGRIAPLLGNAEQWVQQYQYRSAPATGGAAHPGPLLWARFDRDSVNHALAGAGVQVWARERPHILVWLAVTDTGGRYLVGSASRAELKQPVEDAGRHRGLPLLLPLLDLEDQSRLDVGEVWGDFSEEIAKASVRYQADGVVVGRVSGSPNGAWQGRWTLYQGGTVGHWEARGAALADAVQAGVDGAADTLAERAGAAGANAAPAEGPLVLVVERIQSAEAYARTFHYLSALEPVAGIQVMRVEPDAVAFQLVLHGARETFTRTLAQGKMLAPVAASLAGAELHYRLIP